MTSFKVTAGLALLLSVMAFNVRADVPRGKPATNIEFNQMIEDNNNDGRQLHTDVKQASKAPIKKDERGKVIDFIDVEIGMGQAPAITDRRFDSVGEPVIVDLKQIIK